jgi:signal transduction histidine kinase
MQEKFGLQVRLETGAVRQTENAHLKVFLFRAVQELLFNVVKHTGTKTARVALSSSDDRSTRAGAATRSRIRVAGADRG